MKKTLESLMIGMGMGIGITKLYESFMNGSLDKTIQNGKKTINTALKK